MRPGIIQQIVLLYVEGCVIHFRQILKIRFSGAYDFRSIFHITYTLICWKFFFCVDCLLSDSCQWANATF